MTPVASSKSDRLLAGCLFAATVLLLWTTHRAQGHSRDEGYYFAAARSYEAWFVDGAREVARGNLIAPFREEFIAQRWGYNFEHPPLAKLSFALSHLLFARGLGLLDDETAFRLPAWVFAGVLSVALFRLGRRWGTSVGLLAPVLFWAVPRHFYNAHHACFDVPIAALWCLFFAVYADHVESGRGAVRVGVVFGLALATKHNAFFLPIAVVLYELLTRWPQLRARNLRTLVPKTFVPMLIAGPVTLYLLWPLLWHHPISRVNAWLAFHLHHVHYPWQYLGEVLRAPPFPVLYPVVLEALTVPAATALALLLGTTAWLVLAVASLRQLSRGQRETQPIRDRVLLLVIIGAAVQFVPFMTRGVPIFGGVKHWLPSVALACIPAAWLIRRSATALLPSLPRAAFAGLSLLILMPGALATAHFHPYGTSAYNELAGGAAGGAALGMQRQFWSNNVTAVLPWLAANAPQGASVYFHEVNFDSFAAYQLEGDIRADIRYARDPRSATIAIYQYHQEFRDREFEIWTELGTRSPAVSFAIDGATQIVAYRRVDAAVRAP